VYEWKDLFLENDLIKNQILFNF